MMVKKPIFSVIIPTFDREPYVIDAVKSAVNASPENTEIIVVNDGKVFSEDTKSVFDSLNICILKTEGRVGAGGARNYGGNHAAGEWLLFLDDDDLISVSYWKLLSNFLLTENRTHLDCCGFCQTTASSDREEMHQIANKEDEKISFEQENGNVLRSKLAALSQGFWVSASTFKKIGGIDEELRVNEDTDLCLELVAYGASCYVSSFNGAIVYKGSRDQGISKSVTKSYNSAERASYFKRIIDKHTKILSTDRLANEWLWKRYLKMAARAKDKSAIDKLTLSKTLSGKAKMFLGLYWIGVFLIQS